MSESTTPIGANDSDKQPASVDRRPADGSRLVLSPIEFTYCVSVAFEDRMRAVALVARTMDDLHAAWDRLTLGDLEMDESRVQRVEIHRMRRPALRVLESPENEPSPATRTP